jgi:hypothetical protein
MAPAPKLGRRHEIHVHRFNLSCLSSSSFWRSMTSVGVTISILAISLGK